jgi:dTDP-glucose 4,6-dehydratase
VAGILRLAWSQVHEPVNIGNPDEFTILECARLVLEITGSRSSIEHSPLPEDDPRQRCPDITRAQELLGWRPAISLEEGLRLSLGYFREAMAWEDNPAGDSARTGTPITV